MPNIKKCVFSTEDVIPGFEGLYQVCSCGQHVWSTRSKIILTPTKEGIIRIYNAQNELTLFSLTPRCDDVRMWTLLSTFLFVFALTLGVFHLYTAEAFDMQHFF